MWTLFLGQNEREASPPGSAWILVPLGNPGEEYAATRHNLGRLLLQRWMDPHGRRPSRLRAFRAGNLYRLDEVRLALVPSTYMNLSGQVCAEAAAAGYAPARMVLLQDDKDLNAESFWTGPGKPVDPVLPFISLEGKGDL